MPVKTLGAMVPAPHEQTIEYLEALLPVLRKHGVSRFSDGVVEVHFAAHLLDAEVPEPVPAEDPTIAGEAEARAAMAALERDLYWSVGAKEPE